MSRGWRYQELAVDDSNAVLQLGGSSRGALGIRFVLFMTRADIVSPHWSSLTERNFNEESLFLFFSGALRWSYDSWYIQTLIWIRSRCCPGFPLVEYPKIRLHGQ